ncbi:hypothetical protein C8J56DRAFT_1048747 [Mycena floridula]|nr:hypothetical protein C8J56DRAFT_1048747 [Mycena floridula]
MQISISFVVLAVLGLSMAVPIAQEAIIDSRSVQDASDIVSRSESMMIHDLSRRAPKSKKELAAIVMKMFKGLKPTPSSAKEAKAPAAKKARDLSSLQERSELIDELIDLVTRKAGDPPPSITSLAQTLLDAANDSAGDQVRWQAYISRSGWQFTQRGSTMGWVHLDTQGFYTQTAVQAEIARIQ